MRRPGPTAAFFLAAAVAAQPAPAAALRALACNGGACWAAGDGAAVLRSTDGGRTWTPRAPDIEANFQAVQATDGAVYFYGGRAVPGHPEAAGEGVIVRTTDGGRSFAAMPTMPVGWLYGGCFAGASGVVWGQAAWDCPAGVRRTIDEGRLWAPASVGGAGYLLGGAFRSLGYGWVVGGALRLVALRQLAEPPIRPPAMTGQGALRAARMVGETACWAAGDDATVLRSGPPARPWDRLAVPVPADARRCADFEALAAAGGRRVWVAGGLIGCLARSDDGGTRWRLLPAPRPGPVHALEALPDGTLLAAGDAGRIWRSTDGGAGWRLVRGPDRTDVLFVAAAGDWSIYPALVAHARAGLSVAVLYATCLPAGPYTPPDQPLRAAAAAAGADGAVALAEFPSAWTDPTGSELTARQILRRWSLALDSPADVEMVRQVAAAIRLYRPAVLAVGPDGGQPPADAPAPRGRLAENRLISRLARRAADLAARDDALGELARAGLEPWEVRRVFVGRAENERWTPPWAAPPPRRRPPAAVVIDGAKFPPGERLPVGLSAASAAWRLGATGLADRPPRYTAYDCEGISMRLRLFTGGLGRGRLVLEPGSAAQRDLAECVTLAADVLAGRTAAAAVRIARAMTTAGSPESAVLAADRLLLCRRRLLAAGRLIEADAALTAFLRSEAPHPLRERIGAAALAMGVSSEWRARLQATGLPVRVPSAERQRAVAAFGRREVWATTPAGRMLHAKALRATGYVPPAVAVARRLAREPYPLPWRRCAMLELVGPGSPVTVEEAVDGRRVVLAGYTAAAGRFDGRLDEDCWKKAAAVALQPAPRPAPLGVPGAAAPAGPGEQATPTLRVVRTAGGFLMLGLRLPRAAGRRWAVDVALDADRDAWTQLVLHWEPGGRSSARLLVRGGAPAELGGRVFAVRAERTEDAWTAELAVALKSLVDQALLAQLWNVQVRARREDLAGATWHYVAPQPDPRLLPERYALLRVPAAGEEPSEAP